MNKRQRKKLAKLKAREQYIRRGRCHTKTHWPNGPKWWIDSVRRTPEQLRSIARYHGIFQGEHIFSALGKRIRTWRKKRQQEKQA